VPLDDKRNWYRYHHLFGDVLRAHLQHDQPDLVRILHRRASKWYEENGLRSDAVRHALAGDDYCLAADLIELAWPEMDQSFQPSTWLAWKTALPEEVVRNRPVLIAGHAWALLDAGEMEAGETYLQAAERLLKTPLNELVFVDEEQFQRLPASIATARAYHAQALGDGAGTVTYGRRALDLLPTDDHVRRGPADALISLAYWANGQLEEAAQALADAMAEFELAGQLSLAISGTFGLADIRLAQGRLRQAEQAYLRSLQLAVRDGAPVERGAAYVYLGLSEVRREQGHLDEATCLMARSKALNEQPPLTNWQYRYFLDQARMVESRGDFDAALAWLDEAARHYVRTPLPDLRPIPAMKARLWLLKGRIDMALSWTSAAGLTAADELVYLREFEHMTLARTLAAKYEQVDCRECIRDALALLRRLLHAAEANDRMGSALEILVLLALVQRSAGDLDAAHVSLGRALALAEPEGYVRIFVDEGPPMADLLFKWNDLQAAKSPYTDMLIAAFPSSKSEFAQASNTRDRQRQPLVDPLTERELEVLQLVAEGLTNREIGRRLYLALDTVKGHNRRIFGKLRAKTRTEAVSRAREARLL
jgi:LuxR family maltose regulon positive regulatory protein